MVQMTKKCFVSHSRGHSHRVNYFLLFFGNTGIRRMKFTVLNLYKSSDIELANRILHRLHKKRFNYLYM